MIATLVLTGVGCLPEADIELELLSFADQTRPDRRPLTQAQLDDDGMYGTYSDGRGEVEDDFIVSEIHLASLLQGRTSNLPLSNCLWLGTDAQGSSGDRLALSWEGLMTSPEEAEIVPNPLRLCRLQDLRGEHAPLSVGTGSQALVGGDFDAALSLDEDGDHAADSDLHLLNVILTAHRSTNADPLGRCPAGIGLFEEDFATPNEATLAGRHFYFVGEETHVPGDGPMNFNCPSVDGCRTTMCGNRCSYRPTVAPGDDLSLRLGWIPEIDIDTGEIDLTVTAENLEERWMQPNIMAVRANRNIARPLRRVAQAPNHRYSWRTPVAGDPGNPTRTRWHENFSPSVIVGEVRFFRLESDGSRVDLDDVDGDGASDIEGNRVILVTSQTRTCLGVPDPGTGARSFPIEQCFDATGQPSTVLATPTYFNSELSTLYGEPLTQPLSWEVVFISDPLAGGDGQLYVEFDLRSEFGPAALTAQPAVVDLGEVNAGARISGWAEIVNVGGPTLVIDDIVLVGPDAGDFAYQLPIRPRAAALPFDFAEGDTGWSIALGEDFAELPLVDLWTDPEAPLALVREAELEGVTLDIYGDLATVENGLPVAVDPASEFSYQAHHTGGPERYLFRSVFDSVSLPYELAAGDALPVRISALPAVYSSQPHLARLRVRAHPLTTPGQVLEIEPTVTVNSKWGPDGAALPQIARFQGPGERHLLLASTGDQPLLRTWIDLEGVDASEFQISTQLPPNRIVEPGEAETFAVAYLAADPPICGQGSPHAATVRISTDAGDQLVELEGCRP